MISNFKRIIILCSTIFIMLSITASYILSRKMMKPIIRSWDKQVEFVENASHELRTPLTIIQNKLELDTGIGISEEALPRIFDRFYREDRARSRESGGSGLGLSIAQWIAGSHHGTIQALHNQPKGMIFRVKLPK
ncbi:ATP-binding protein [Paenibacillus azoreducens]|uniref:ATP-binding protein n=1 Tax=Paenibacillus azoreducens TaxID=116718 RepID=UPI002351A439|nr:ATP-binding protein [Paenibacillus azoreducens]